MTRLIHLGLFAIMLCAAGSAADPVGDGSRVLFAAGFSRVAQVQDVTLQRAAPLAEQLLEKQSKVYDTARDSLDRSFIEHETRRFVVLSNADTHWSRSQAEYLERAWHQFVRYTRRLDLQPTPLRHKLVCILFEHEDDYRAFAAKHDEVYDPWILGYYSPKHDWIVFYHVKGDDADATRRKQASIATTIHEAIHQLHFHTNIQSLRLQYPLWICEGLATAFETDQPGHAFGPDHEYQPRRERFANALRDDVLLPLRELVTITHLSGEDSQRISVIYHQSYALVTWLYRFRPDELRTYLQLMLDEPPGKVDASRQEALFEQAFGSIDLLERRWLNHERQTR